MHPSGVRPPAVAGSWYPGEAAALRAAVDNLLAETTCPPCGGALRALVVPHAGLAYSGPTAAQGWIRSRDQPIDRVVVLAPNHRALLRGAAVDPSSYYETPLGNVRVDLEAVAALGAERCFVADPRPFMREHAIEMQLPFLQVLHPEASLVPVLVGEASPPEIRAIAAALLSIHDALTLIVVSSDFTHYGEHYSYVPFTEQIPERIQALDAEAIAAIVERDAERFSTHLEETGATICGRKPLGVLLQMVQPNWMGEIGAYTTSGAITGDFGHSVSYAALAFHAPGVDASVTEPLSAGRDLDADLDATERRALLFVARQAIEALFDPPPLEERLATVTRTARLAQPRAVFVSLHRRRDGRLRGCIGALEPRLALFDAVIENAHAAALRDPRFSPLRADELSGLEIEISVLRPLLAVQDIETIVIGRDGLAVTRGTKRGVLLPQVATEQRWSRDVFLDNVCRKAGLPEDDWRHPGIEIERFEALVISESEWS